MNFDLVSRNSLWFVRLEDGSAGSSGMWVKSLGNSKCKCGKHNYPKTEGGLEHMLNKIHTYITRLTWPSEPSISKTTPQPGLHFRSKKTEFLVRSSNTLNSSPVILNRSEALIKNNYPHHPSYPPPPIIHSAPSVKGFKNPKDWILNKFSINIDILSVFFGPSEAVNPNHNPP